MVDRSTRIIIMSSCYILFLAFIGIIISLPSLPPILSIVIGHYIMHRTHTSPSVIVSSLHNDSAVMEMQKDKDSLS